MRALLGVQMAVDPSDIERARDLLIEAGATRVVLFGSAARDPSRARDLDLGCSGIPPSQFFRVYGRLLAESRTMVDLVDLDDGSAFARRVEAKGRLLYVRQ